MNEDHLTEKEALKQAKAEGIEFEDHYTFDGAEKEYETKEDAKADADGKPVVQVRRIKQ